MKYKTSLGSKLFDVCNYVFMLFVIIACVYPMLYVLFASFSDSSMLLGHTDLLLAPLGFMINAYEAVFSNPNIMSGYGVTILVVVVGTFLDLVMTTLAAFVLSREGFMFRKALTLLVIFTMYFSGGMIPRYLFISNTLGLSNSLLTLILPGLISPWNLLIMRTNFETIPRSLEESAKIDGATDLTVYFKIIIPLSKAIIAVILLICAVGRWNAWFDAFLFIRERAKYPLQIILREILLLSSTESMMEAGLNPESEAIAESIKYATIVVATVPVLCVYPFIQKHFTKGMMLGAVKG